MRMKKKRKNAFLYYTFYFLYLIQEMRDTIKIINRYVKRQICAFIYNKNTRMLALYFCIEIFYLLFIYSYL